MKTMLMKKIKPPFLAINFNGTAQFAKQFSTSLPVWLHHYLDEPDGPNILTDVPGPKSQALIQQLSALQVSLFMSFF